MGRLSAGTLLFLVGAMAFASSLTMASTAAAAGIPPTAECVRTAKELIREQSRSDDSAAAQRLADRKLARGLFEAGCITAAAPLLRTMRLKPYTAECSKAASAAGRYWRPHSRKLNQLHRRWRLRLRPLHQRSARIYKRVVLLRAKGAPKTRINPLVRRFRALRNRLQRATNRQERQTIRLVRPQAYDTYLIVAELTALRCLNLDSAFEGKAAYPAGRVARNHRSLIFSSIIAIVERLANDSDGARSSKDADRR